MGAGALAIRMGPLAEAATRSAGVTGDEPVVVPTPMKMVSGTGTFTLNDRTVISPVGKHPGLAAGAELLGAELRPPTGLALPVRRCQANATPAGTIALELTTLPELGEQGYRLNVTPEGARIRANTPQGIFYGGVTLRQLFPPEIESDTRVTDVAWTAPCVSVVDRPRYRWRGLMLDSGRQYQTMAFLKSLLDLMASLKMNVFHWHLTENDGWRVEIKKYPRLTTVGSQVANGPEQHGYYTQEQIREIVAYAKGRHIDIMPEIDVPGHAEAALKSYPQHTCSGRLVKQYRGHSPNIFCGGKEATYTFLTDVLDEVCELFPFEYIHIGGDEAPKKNWNACPDCQAAVKKLGLSSSHQLQIHMTNRLADHLGAKGRKAVCWDDVVAQPGQPMRKNVVVHWWNYRGRKVRCLVAGTKLGHEVLASPNYYTYLNFPVKPWRGYRADRTFDLRMAYAENPVEQIAKLPEKDRRHVLGVSPCLWTDHGLTQRLLPGRLFPRLLALEELAWHVGKRLPFAAFARKVDAVGLRLKAMGIACGPAATDGK